MWSFHRDLRVEWLEVGVTVVGCREVVGAGCERGGRDGKFVCYAKDPEVPTCLWKVPVDGGEETRVLDSIGHGTNFAVVNEGIYFLSGDMTSKTPGVPVQFFSFATGQIKTVSTSTVEKKNVWGGLSVSPDGRWVLFTYIDYQGSDLLLVENFQ
jgi:hypothetical protein